MGSKGSLNYDFVLATGIFLTFYLLLFSNLSFFIAGRSEFIDEFQFESEYIADLILRNAGSPKNWTSIDSIDSFGLAWFNHSTASNILDKIKLQQMNGVTCDSLKSLLTIDPEINFRIDVGTIYNCSATAPSNARLIRRLVYVVDIDVEPEAYAASYLELRVW